MASREPSVRVILAGIGVVGLKILASLPQLAGQTAAVAITWLVTVSFIVIGLMLLATDVPRINGWTCMGVALSTVPGDLNDPHFTGSGLSVLGFVGEPIYLVAASALVLRYPRAALTRREHRLLIAMLVVGLLDRVGTALTRGGLADGFYRPPGWRSLPLDPIWHDAVLVRGGRSVMAALLLATAVVLAARLARARGLARQSQAALILIGALCAFAAAIDQAVWAVNTPTALAIPGALVRNLAAALLPVALIADLLRRRAAGAAVSHRILTAALSGNPAEIADAVRDVFADPSAQVEVRDAQGRWLAVGDSDRSSADSSGGGSRDAARRSPRRVETIRLDDGSTPLRIDLDARVITDDGLLTTALGAVRTGVHNTRLRSDLLQALSQLHDSRLRIVEETLAERRRVERDLHDGAQQQFLAVAATLAQTDLVADEDVRRIVATARATLSDALAELRSLARGIHPAALSQGGLRAALPALRDRAPWPVRLDLAPDLDDLPETITAATYFLVAELLSNADRHAGASAVAVAVERDGEALRVKVRDDGVGGARVIPGGGLAGLQDRVQALGGTLDLRDRCPGTEVSAVLPLAAGVGPMTTGAGR